MRKKIDAISRGTKVNEVTDMQMQKDAKDIDKKLKRRDKVVVDLSKPGFEVYDYNDIKNLVKILSDMGYEIEKNSNGNITVWK